ncbi:MAG: response regulator transcription factor [Betaproteobacteria bacterium]
MKRVPHEAARSDRAAAARQRGPVVHVVDDDPSFLRAVSRRLEAAGFDVEAFGSAEAFLARRSHLPGCVVVDLRLKGQSGLDLQDADAAADDPLPLVFLSGHGDVHSSVRAMKRGAVDFLTKPVSGGDLIDAVRRAIALDAGARADREAYRELRRRYERLTPREREVFALVARGLLNKQIAAELGTSERTIKAHRARVMEKMGAQSVTDLTRSAERLRTAPASGHALRAGRAPQG